MNSSGQSNAFLIYQDDNGISNVNVRFEGEDVWLAAEQLQMLFQASRQDVAYHIEQIYADGELSREATCKKFLQVRQEGTRSVKRSFAHYNLDMILAVGMRIRSDVAVRFRQWAIRHLHEFAVKGFTEARSKAVEEFREYRRREMIQYESDFDRAIRELTENGKQSDKELNQ